MPCEPIHLPDGTSGFVCYERGRRTRRACSSCGRTGADLLCDFPLPSRSGKGKRAAETPPQLGLFQVPEAVPMPAAAPPPKDPTAKTCDRPLCRRCATAWKAAGPDRDLCLQHAVEAGLVGAVRIPCWPVYGRPAGPPAPSPFHPRPDFAPPLARHGGARCR